jgi:hypothetical protein
VCPSFGIVYALFVLLWFTYVHTCFIYSCEFSYRQTCLIYSCEFSYLQTCLIYSCEFTVSFVLPLLPFYLNCLSPFHLHICKLFLYMHINLNTLAKLTFFWYLQDIVSVLLFSFQENGDLLLDSVTSLTMHKSSLP